MPPKLRKHARHLIIGQQLDEATQLVTLGTHTRRVARTDLASDEQHDKQTTAVPAGQSSQSWTKSSHGPREAPRQSRRWPLLLLRTQAYGSRNDT
jgi:hypothetical protein